MSEKANFRALLPMIVFLVLFIGTGIALTAAGADMPFYQLSATVAIIPAIVLAIPFSFTHLLSPYTFLSLVFLLLLFLPPNPPPPLPQYITIFTQKLNTIQ